MVEEPSQAPALDPRTLSQLAGGLAHELKNPLSTLGLHLALLREQWQDEDGPKARRTVRTLDTLRTEVLRLNEILEDFLRFARTDQIDLQTASLNEIVERVISFVAPEAHARQIEVRSFLDLDLPPMRLDAGGIRQALLNLVINARQALEEKGGLITVITRRDGDHVLLEVVDDGPGMDPQQVESCLQVYYSTKKEGSGLGLPTVRRITEAHGGSLEIESTSGAGTRIGMRLPMQTAEFPTVADDSERGEG
ncbi:MAG: two-component sensor histidine kinase [Planctomycetota bacterium]|nr:MAG: two-component sensor histidine kinase [Planctomycetota bacterium]